MDFENARWVKLYCQDTGTWLRLGWQGRTVALHLLRSVNSSGVLSDLGTEPELILAELLRLPLEVVTPGLSALVRTGTVTLGGGILVWTAFVDAQRSRKSETQRKAEYRAKHRQEAISGQNGTLCPENGTERPESVQVCPECPTTAGQNVPEEKREERREVKRKEYSLVDSEPSQPELALVPQQAAESGHKSQSDKPGAEQSQAKPKRASTHTAIATTLLGELSAARMRVNPRNKAFPPSPAHLREIERCLRDGLTVDQLRNVILVWEEMVKAGKQHPDHFDSLTPFRASNVAKYTEKSLEEARRPWNKAPQAMRPPEPTRAVGNPSGGLDLEAARAKAADKVDPVVQAQLDKLLGRT